MRMTKGQSVFVLVVALVNVVLWIIPSEVVELVARDRQTLLGRYSRTHFAWIVALIPVSGVAIYLHLAVNWQVKKKRMFRVAAVLLVLVPLLLAADVYLRLTKRWGYLLDGLAYRRSPGEVFHGAHDDKPQAYRSYPNAPSGYGRVTWTLTADKRGFRNRTDLDRYDVVALGDSFAEGSEVSDEQVWPAQFADRSGLSVCNLGMSGYAPHHYLAALKRFGLALKPKWVVCLLHEGNDFQKAKIRTEARTQWRRYVFKRSPIVERIDEFLIRTFGPIGASRSLKELDILSWLPIAYPPGPDANHYAFPPSFLVNHYVSRMEFETGKHWKRTRHNLDQIRKRCSESGATLILVYAPTKPHVVLPLVRDQLPAEKVHAFTALRAKRKLPAPNEFVANLLDDLDGPEIVTRQWCREHSVPFVSLTNPLRDAVRRGEQPYFTYNAHWTPVGHAVVGRVVTEAWQHLTAPPTDAAVSGSADRSRPGGT